MARQVITTLIDDIDGSEATETVDFGIDGYAYTIDLSEKNADKLRTLLDPFIGAGTRVGRTGASSGAMLPRGAVGSRSRASVAEPQKADRKLNQAIREWAHSAGHRVSDRGRIPTEIIELYHQGQRSAASLLANQSNGNGKAAKKTAGKPAGKPAAAFSG